MNGVAVHKRLSIEPLPSLYVVYRPYFAMLGQTVTDQEIQVMSEADYMKVLGSFRGG